MQNKRAALVAVAALTAVAAPAPALAVPADLRFEAARSAGSVPVERGSKWQDLRTDAARDPGPASVVQTNADGLRYAGLAAQYAATSQTRSAPVAKPVADGSRYADMAAHREAISTRHWQQANTTPVVALVRAQPDGFDWPSALVGAGAALALSLLSLLAGPAVLRRRPGAAAPA